MNSLFRTITDSQSHKVISLDPAETIEQKIFIEDLQLEMFIGVFDHEKGQKQKVTVSAEIDVTTPKNWRADDITEVLSYDDVVQLIKKTASEENHIHLVETFAEKIIEGCFQHPQAKSVSITVNKTDIYDDIKSVGVRIKKTKS